jgi:mannose-6-phosphate isomerase-like protein (cupin superfamily)
MKLVNESLEEMGFKPGEEDKSKDETNFSKEQKATIEKFVRDYQGDFEDEDIHNLADKLGLDKPEVEEFIYNMARNKPSKEDLKKDSSKKGFHSNIEKDTLQNDDFRKVLYTGEHLQLVLMILKPGEEIGEETHETIDQFFRFEEGKGKCIINGNSYNVTNGDVIIIPFGSKHNIINVDKKASLKMYTIYTPPNHKDGVTFETKEAAEKSKEEFDGVTTE